MKRIIAFALALALTISAIPLFATPASAASCDGTTACRCRIWPVFSATAYCEFKATKTIPCWRDPDFTTRGTISPQKSYNAYISKNDICKIIGLDYNYLIVKYPTPAGERTAYIRMTDLFGVLKPREYGIVQGKATTYSNTSGSVYGSTAKNDYHFVCGGNDEYKLIMYTAISGNRIYKLGYVKNADYYTIIRSRG